MNWPEDKVMSAFDRVCAALATRLTCEGFAFVERTVEPTATVFRRDRTALRVTLDWDGWELFYGMAFTPEYPCAKSAWRTLDIAEPLDPWFREWPPESTAERLAQAYAALQSRSLPKKLP